MPSDSRELTFSRDYVVYAPRNQGVYPIPESEWNRLKRRVGAIVPARRMFQNGGSILIGLSVSAGFSLLGFQTAAALAPWVVPTTWAILVSSLVLGVGFFLLDRFQRDTIQSSVKEVITEMGELEESYVKGGAGGVDPQRDNTSRIGTRAPVPSETAMGRPPMSPEAPVKAPVGGPSGQADPAIRLGARVTHRRFGAGTVIELLGNGHDLKGRVEFDDPAVGTKTLVISEAGLTRV